MDLVITFNNYAVDGLTLDGKVEFFDTSSSRSACSSSGCAFANHSRISYATDDGGGNLYPPVSIQFANGGSNVSDKILIKAGKSDNMRWEIRVTNSANQVFSFSY
jgi:hypothetical protein